MLRWNNACIGSLKREICIIHNQQQFRKLSKTFSKIMSLLTVNNACELYYIMCRDAETIKEWRRNERSFSKSMGKVSRRNEGT